ncbi:hypothetical protein DMA11_15440 [Marinilabiliaceae bacterium JC017]|nr:hypothetical protein DMA11_15440 [Marinilabiliaceae bacterium JC017]
MAICAIILLSCEKDEALSTENSLLSFKFEKNNNDELASDINCEINAQNGQVTGVCPVNTDLTKLVPSFETSENASLILNNTKLESGTAVHDFSTTQTCTITAEDGTKRNYTIAITTETLPEVKIAKIVDVDYLDITLNISLLSQGTKNVDNFGICWGTSEMPTMEENKAETTMGENITIKTPLLKSDTKYYVRAFAKSSIGISYSEQIEVNTKQLPASVEPLIDNKWTVFEWPYNAYFPDYSGENNINNKFPAPCGATTIARLLGYWKDKITYTGNISSMNTWNEVKFTCDLDNIQINYNNLPASLDYNSTENEYKDVSKIFLVAGAVGLTNNMDYGTPPDSFIEALKKYFNVGDDIKFAKRWEHNKDEWIEILKAELAKGHPLAIAARTADSPAPDKEGQVSGHWFNIEGYNAENKFYIDYNYGGNAFRGYYDVDDFGEFNSYGMVITGFEPKH